MATNNILNAIAACTGCRSHARINITNYVETEHFDSSYTIHRIHCGECCTTPIGTHSPFEALAHDRDTAAKRWNDSMSELREEELEYDRGRVEYENSCRLRQPAPTGAW